MDRLAATVASGLVSPPPEGLTAEQLVKGITAREQMQRSLNAAQQADLAAFQTARHAADRRSDVGRRLTGRTVGTEIGLALGISPTAGAARVSFARSVVGDHPALHTLASAGQISEWALRTITTITCVLDTDQQAAVAAQLAADITDRATHGRRQYTPYELGQAAAARVLAADADAATTRCQQARADRRVTISDKHDGVASLFATGPAEDTIAIYDTLDDTARARRDDGDERCLGDLMFATLVESILGVPAPDHTTTTAASDPAGAAAGGDGGGGLSQHDLDPDDATLDSYPTDQPPPATTPSPARLRRRSPVTVQAQIVLGAATLLGLDDGTGAAPRLRRDPRRDRPPDHRQLRHRHRC